jgi:hypothetical protein
VFTATTRRTLPDTALIVPRGGPAAPSLRVPVLLLADRRAATPVLRAHRSKGRADILIWPLEIMIPIVWTPIRPYRWQAAVGWSGLPLALPVA